MNRQERRKKEKAGLKVAKDPMISVKKSELIQMKQNAVYEAVDSVFLLMLGIPVMIMHDKYPSLMRREVDGKNRTERFADMCMDLYDSYAKGYVSLEDIKECLWAEGGIRLTKEK